MDEQSRAGAVSAWAVGILFGISALTATACGGAIASSRAAIPSANDAETDGGPASTAAPRDREPEWRPRDRAENVMPRTARG